MRESLTINEYFPGRRIANALVSYIAYMAQFFCPLGLVAYYPHPRFGLPVWKAVGAGGVGVHLGWGGACWRRYPYLLMGWLWYLGMLVPVIGVRAVRRFARADRFTYLPQIGLCLALVWGVTDLCRFWPYRRWVCGVASALVLAALMGCAWRQTSFWHDSETMLSRTLACTSGNYLAHTNLGVFPVAEGRFDEAVSHYREAMKINPNYACPFQPGFRLG